MTTMTTDDSIPRLASNEVHAALEDLLDACARALYVAGREYQEQMPADAHAFAALLAAGRIVPAARIELPPDGARVALGYVETNGTFHSFFSNDAHGAKSSPGRAN